MLLQKKIQWLELWDMRFSKQWKHICWSFGSQHHVNMEVDINASPKHWYLPTSMHSVTTKETNITITKCMTLGFSHFFTHLFPASLLQILASQHTTVMRFKKFCSILLHSEESVLLLYLDSQKDFNHDTHPTCYIHRNHTHLKEINWMQ
jgi:hypothetical protein